MALGEGNPHSRLPAGTSAGKERAEASQPLPPGFLYFPFAVLRLP